MKALCWMGREDVRIEDVPDPRILNPRDAIVRVTSTAICGSDLHLYGGFIPTLERGDILGHEFMGEVVEVGGAVKNLAPGDRVLVPFPISCGSCWFCRQDLWSLCDNSNPNAWMAEELFGHSPAGLFGYSHLLGGYAGGQAEYVRVPFADVGPLKLDASWSDDQVLLLTDVIPTGWMAAEQGDIQPSDVVAVWGCGPVGQIAIRAARLLGAATVIAIDRVDARLRLAEKHGARTIDYEEETVLETLRDLTAGRGPDVCIDAVGLEAHGSGPLAIYDRVATSVRFETDRSTALREAIMACRKGGILSIAGVYGGYLDKVPLGAAFNKALQLRMGQTHVHRYLRPLLERIGKGELDATDLITHHMPLERAPDAYEIFRSKEDECIKVVLQP
jgi:threonine dehydrogenase-like Zn-dependent dehydrogenase